MDDFVASQYLHCVMALRDIYREISKILAQIFSVTILSER